MKTAIVYDRVNKWGGAERVLLALHEMFPQAPLYTSVYDPKNAPWAEVFPLVNTSFLNKFAFLRNKHQILSLLMPIAFESFNFDDYDLVITVTSEYAKGIITKPQTKHICYCLTPTRYLWSGYDTYFKGFPFKGLTKPIVSYLRNYDRTIAQRPDMMIAISTEVKNRIKKYYNRDCEIIYPPVCKIKNQKSKFKSTSKKSKLLGQNKFKELKDYYLIVSRLVPYKRVDLAIEAFIKLGLPLVVVGTGSEEKKYKFKYRFNKNIIFCGFVEENDLPVLYKNAKAFIMPQEEDFGITAVEAQTFGCPVIAYGKGGAIDSVIPGETGVFFDKQTKDELIGAVRNFLKLSFSREKIIDNGLRFDTHIFKREFANAVKIMYI